MALLMAGVSRVLPSPGGAEGPYVESVPERRESVVASNGWPNRGRLLPSAEPAIPAPVSLRKSLLSEGLANMILPLVFSSAAW